MKHRSLHCLILFSLLAAAPLVLCGCGMDVPNQITSNLEPARNSYDYAQIGQTLEADASVDSNPTETATVEANLRSCEILDRLPRGYNVSDVSIYDADKASYNEEFGLWSIDDSGEISEGWSLVWATIDFANRNEFDVSLKLSDISIAHKDDSGRLAEISSSETWIMGSELTQKGYYQPTLSAGETKRFSLGFFVQTESLTGNIVLALQNETGKNESHVIRYFDLDTYAYGRLTNE